MTMERCKKCIYPSTTKPYILFDDKGICGGCRVSEEKEKIDWTERAGMLKDLVAPYKKETGYDCIVPISGGKDSHYQVHYVKEILGLHPLVVTFNHLDNSKTGIANLENMISKLGVDLVRFTPNPQTVKKTCRHAIELMADPFWHEHAGIMSVPTQMAVKYDIPLIIWGEQGYLDLVGMFSHNDFVEMNKKTRQEHMMRGYEPEDFVKDNKEGLTIRDLEFTQYPSDEILEEKGIRGIYLGNYINWKPIEQTKLMIEKYGFMTDRKERTFNIYENAECYFNDTVHDYMKYLKFGYNRCVDHASQLIRAGLINRDEGAYLANLYNQPDPDDKFVEFCKWIEMDPSIVRQKALDYWEAYKGDDKFNPIKYVRENVRTDLLKVLYEQVFIENRRGIRSGRQIL